MNKDTSHLSFKPQIIVKMRADNESHPNNLSFLSDKILAPLFKPLFPEIQGFFAPNVATTANSRFRFARDKQESAGLRNYFYVDAPDAPQEMMQELLSNDKIEACYLKPTSAPPAMNAMVSNPNLPPPQTPDLSGNQLYLGSAPMGIDAQYAWAISGGKGYGVRVVDMEWAWHLDHEDLRHINPTGGSALIHGQIVQDNDLLAHGTAVIGVLGSAYNGMGVKGICPDATLQVAAFSTATSTDIFAVVQQLSAGDILLLEIHRPGPKHNFEGREDQRGYIPIEWWQDDYAVIRYAVGRGIIVVEAGGNGSEDLDDPLYDIPFTSNERFSDWWVNPFRRAQLDSGAIVVGAGSPPPGTHGRTWLEDRAKLDFSNYGTVIDAQGWGREVTTCGYGDLQGGADPNCWYTDQFAGTSSASPIVAGALACVQGMLKAAGHPPLTPMEARVILRGTGSPQQVAPSETVLQRIGTRPNLRQMTAFAFALRNSKPPH